MDKPDLSRSLKKCSLCNFVFYAALLFSLVSCSSQNIAVEDLRCEYQSNPLGVDAQSPRFSWKIMSDERGIYQRSYQVLVSKSLKEIDQKNGQIWNSGIVESANTVNVEYEGIPLESDQTYFWSVCVRADDGAEYWSKPASFHTGLFLPADWQAKWITTNEEIVDASPIFRKEFSTDKKVKQAFAFVTAAGFYELYLNGEKLGEHVLDPAITDYRKRVLYSTFDATELLQKGKNALGVMLGNGAYNLRKTNERYSWGSEGSQLGNPCFIMQLNITFDDGSHEVVTTDETWKYTDGPITFNNIYGGEDYDARKEIDGWSSANFAAGDWTNAKLSPDPGGKLRAQLLPPIQVAETVLPVTSTQISDGVYLFDLGQNIAGWWRLEMRGKAGQTIRVRGAETLNDSLFPKPLEAGDRLSEKDSYHALTWTDYTLKDDQDVIYEPRFFYTGFRYIEVTTSDRKNLDKLKVEGRVVRSMIERNGTFVSSDSLLNQIHKAGLWSQKANNISYPTDCPQREKGAYNGDGQVIAETSIHDFQMASFYTKWLNDMRDAQEENGRIPNTSPTLVGGMGGGVAWGSAYILIPYWMNHYYNDTRILKEHYPTMKKYLQYLINLAKTDANPDEPYIVNDFDSYWYSLGEWCAPGESDCPNHPVVNTFYYYYNAKLLSKIAALLENTDDARRFAALSDTIKQEFNKKFFNPETSLYGTDNTYQTYQLLALHGDVVPSEYRDEVLKTIVDDIHARNGHLHTGIIGTKYLWPVLVQGNQADLAFQVATRKTYPSYGYWIANNSTTFVEHWDGRGSHNHQMFGSVVEYFYKYLAGIQSPMEGKTKKGYRQIYLRPSVPVGLTSVEASQETVAGQVISSWTKLEGSFEYDVTLPSNTAGMVVLPAFDFKNLKLKEGGTVIWEKGDYVKGVSGIQQVHMDADGLIVKLESGSYKFELTGR